MAFRSRVRYGVAAAVVGWAVVMAGCATGQKDQSDRSAGQPREPATIRTVNSICPMSGLPVGDDGAVAMYRNAVVGFCCRRCVTPWMLLSDREKRHILAEIAPNTELSFRTTPRRNPFR